MAKVLVIGGGVVGLSTGMLLAKDGHHVTVLERDAAAPPGEANEAWVGWERRGVNQFRMVHFFQPRFRKEIEAELPEVAAALDAAGAIRFNAVADAPVEMTGGPREGDDDFTALTGKRPTVEAAMAAAAEDTANLTVRRGVAVDGLLTAGEGPVPHLVGVRTQDGEELRADLVVDTSGRRSPLPRWLEAIGARPYGEELEDSGFIYYGRHFRSADGSTPPVMSPLLSNFGSMSVLTLPADNGTWGVAFIAYSGDAELRGLRDVERWSATLKECALLAHWGDGEPIEDDVAVMTKIEDRIRHFVVDGVPVATGLAAVGDAWACTNPSVGRGASIGLIHALALRDLLRTADLSDRTGFALAWHDATNATVEPWYRATLSYDRHRLAEIKAAIAGQPYEPGDPVWEITRGLQYGAMQDPDLLRAFLRIASVLADGSEVLSEPGIMDKVMTVGADWRNEPVFGPDRERLVTLAGG